ncbi:MAG TPA: FAD-binding oxidoreductase, partial [Solirubrobacterales bacterium]|nr:FAD-binding oxidoreductase [Solirubrobacterales bacterium]
GLTMRCFPQSFEYATLGGWIATRAGGHFATKETHVDDLVESVRAVTPRGTWESRRLPGSGAGPSPDRLLLGSEGILGAITDAWVRVRPRPEWKAAATVRFERFADACEAVREIVQAGLDPANCRLLEAAEAEMTGAGDGSSHLLLLAFESAHHPVDAALTVAIAAAAEHGGKPDAPRLKEPPMLTGRKLKNGLSFRPTNGEDGGAANSWRGAFLLAPYLRDTFVSCGVLSETFETAITWDRLEEFHATVMETTRRVVAEVSGAPREGRGAPLVTCRFTHAYPDGVAPYFTVLAPAIRGGEVEQWDEIKAAVSDVLVDGGGTITHHHAVGRDHRPWYDRQRPAPFAAVLRAAKAELDPAAILNPGVLLDP